MQYDQCAFGARDGFKKVKWLWKRADIKNAMMLIDIKQNGKFLYETMPHVFPEGFLTETETTLWSFFYKQKMENLKK